MDIDQKQCRKRKQNIAKKGHTNCFHVEIKRIDVLDASSRVRMRPSMENKGSSEAHPRGHGLRTPNEGINQRNLKVWADEADKICFGRT